MSEQQENPLADSRVGHSTRQNLEQVTGAAAFESEDAGGREFKPDELEDALEEQEEANERRSLVRSLTRPGIEADEADAAATTIQAQVRAWLARKIVGTIREQKAEAHMTEFSNTEFMSLLFSCALPLLDAVSDGALLYEWYNAGDQTHMDAFLLLVFIHLMSGTVSGLLFSQWNQLPESELTGRILDNTLVGVLLGWFGLIPVFQSIVSVNDARSEKIEDVVARHDLMHLKVVKIADLLLETLPALVLQMGVGITLGELDGSSPFFSWTLMISVISGIVGPGFALMTVEALGRNQQRREVRRIADETGQQYTLNDPAAIMHQDFPTLRWDQSYYRVSVLWRVTQVGSIALWFALSACAFGKETLFAAPFAIAVFCLSAFEAAFVRSTMDDDGREIGPAMQYMIFAVAAAMLHQIIIAVLALTFFFMEHDENDYLAYRHANADAGAAAAAGGGGGGGGGGNSTSISSSELTMPTDSLDCKGGSALFGMRRADLACVVWAASFLVGIASLYLDPQHGKTAAAKGIQAQVTKSDEAIMLDWLEGNEPWAEPPQLGHKGRIMFQFSHARRKRMHKCVPYTL